jgi:2,3-bisphosphoglycerate-independent phosphoglycerate mutase
MPRVLFIFLDGVGLGDDDVRYNPFLSARIPVIRELLGGALPTLSNAGLSTSAASLRGLDATLGVAGLPQSGTGQTALLTGVNAPAIFGSHSGPFVPVRLRKVVATQSFLAIARTAGHSVAFANAYPEELLKLVTSESDVERLPGPLRAGPPLAAFGAGLLTRATPDLMRGEAVATEITNGGWIERLLRADLPLVSPATAGQNLARIAGAHDLTFFAHYATDEAGHTADDERAVKALERVDEFVGGVIATLPADVVMVIASDHGNIEDTRGGHTRNPAFCLVMGSGHEVVANRLHQLTDVPESVLSTIGTGRQRLPEI